MISSDGIGTVIGYLILGLVILVIGIGGLNYLRNAPSRITSAVTQQNELRDEFLKEQHEAAEERQERQHKERKKIEKEHRAWENTTVDEAACSCSPECFVRLIQRADK